MGMYYFSVVLVPFVHVAFLDQLIIYSWDMHEKAQRVMETCAVKESVC